MNAGFGIRLGAVLVDSIILAIPISIISLILTGSMGLNENFPRFLYFLYNLIVPIYWNGHTLGKRMCGIRISRVNEGDSPGLGNMLLRTLGAGIVYAITFGIGLVVSVIMVLVREDSRGLHDLIAGTEVVYD